MDGLAGVEGERERPAGSAVVVERLDGRLAGSSPWLTTLAKPCRPSASDADGNSGTMWTDSAAEDDDAATAAVAVAGESWNLADTAREPVEGTPVPDARAATP